QNKDEEGLLDDYSFFVFLNGMIGFVWTYALTRPGVNALRTPIYKEMINIVENRPINYSSFKFNADNVRAIFDAFSFYNGRPITKSIITWWAFQDDKQPLLSLETTFEIEHIYARNRNDKEGTLSDPKKVEYLGNKALLEKKINIRASDYRFSDKKKYYQGGVVNKRNQVKEGTKIKELTDLANTLDDYTEKEIDIRNKKIIDGFIKYIGENGLLEE
ncbi:MAG: HNH endonuclease family protein, partial [Lachnospiraceae bacterium]|nr:HNH endonuclease family protein [Lachnospiraceae bacterium]